MLTANTSLLQAFQTASGVSADQLSLFIRTLILGGCYVWAVWVIYGIMEEHHHNGLGHILGELKKVSRVLLVVVLMTILVFVH